MKYVRPDMGRVRELVEEEDLFTIIVPWHDAELTKSEQRTLERSVERTNGSDGETRDVFLTTDIKNSERTAEVCELDIELLAKLLYEHKRYSQARGFSDAEMDVLRAVEFHEADRVGVDEIMESPHAEDLAESTVYKALRTLQEKELITKIRPGVYQYRGP